MDVPNHPRGRRVANRYDVVHLLDLRRASDSRWRDPAGVAQSQPVLVDQTIQIEFTDLGPSRLWFAAPEWQGGQAVMLDATVRETTAATVPFLEHWGMVWIEYRTQPGTCGCPSDLNEDGFVGFSDVLEVVASWGPCLGCLADVNNDGAVEFAGTSCRSWPITGIVSESSGEGGVPSDGPVGSVPCRNGCRKCRLRIGPAPWMSFNTTGGMTRSGLCNKKQWQQAFWAATFVGDAHWWGKELCYQLPPLVAGRVDIVVSPLIALMEDQIQPLRSVGVEAAAMHSGLSNQAHHEVLDGIRDGRWSLLFCAPERVVDPRWIEVMRAMRIGAIAIDEAHRISDWGHDFRPEYRQLAGFANTSQACRCMRSPPPPPQGPRRHHSPTRVGGPVELVGHFDDPIWYTGSCPRMGATDRIASTLDRHRGEGAIVYCRSRSETERYAESLRKRGLDAGHYHAGMDASGPRACAACIQGRTPRCGVCDGGVWDGHRPVQCALCDSRLFARVHRAVPAGNRTGWTRRSGGGMRAAVFRGRCGALERIHRSRGARVW